MLGVKPGGRGHSEGVRWERVESIRSTELFQPCNKDCLNESFLVCIWVKLIWNVFYCKTDGWQSHFMDVGSLHWYIRRFEKTDTLGPNLDHSWNLCCGPTQDHSWRTGSGLGLTLVMARSERVRCGPKAWKTMTRGQNVDHRYRCGAFSGWESLLTRTDRLATAWMSPGEMKQFYSRVGLRKCWEGCSGSPLTGQKLHTQAKRLSYIGCATLTEPETQHCFVNYQLFGRSLKNVDISDSRDESWYMVFTTLLPS